VAENTAGGLRDIPAAFDREFEQVRSEIRENTDRLRAVRIRRMRSIKSRSRLASSNTRRPDFAFNSFSNPPFLQFIRSANALLLRP
jgi:hypothetical protein